MKTKISENLKMQMIGRYRSGEKAARLTVEYGISKSTFYRWINECSLQDSADANILSLHSTNQKLAKAEQIIQIKELVNCNTKSPLKEKLYELEKLKDKFSIPLLATALNVDKGTLYNHILRNKKQDTTYSKRRLEITEQVKIVYDESNQIFGAGKIYAVLKTKGIKTSVKYVQGIMGELGISSISPNSKKTYALLSPKNKFDILKKNFDVSALNEVWVSDTTSFKIKEKWYFICAIINLFSRKVIAYKISPKHTTNLISATFKLAYTERKPQKLIFHSDRGCQYTANSFMKMLKDFEVTQSFSPSGSPYHNAVMESFFSYMKREEIYRTKYRSYEDFKRKIAKYIAFYNDKRPHSYLHFKTPNEYEKIYLEKCDKKVQK